MSEVLARPERAALALATDWLGQRFFRTFRLAEGDPAPFDARLRQRDRSIGVTLARLWDEPDGRARGVDDLERLVSADLEEREQAGAYVLWTPPGGSLPVDEPARSEFRLLIGRGLTGLAPGQRRELRIPVVLRLARIEPEGAYVMVTGALSSEWTRISEGVTGVYHLDARELCRLPDEPAELEIILSRIRDRAAMLRPQEVTDIHVHDYWTVSRLPVDEPAGLTVVAAPPATSMADADDGIRVRRGLRRAVRRAAEQRANAPADFSVLVLLDVLGHIESELATQSLRGMSPASYGGIDQILLVADGRIREVLQPRSAPWAA